MITPELLCFIILELIGPVVLNYTHSIDTQVTVQVHSFFFSCQILRKSMCLFLKKKTGSSGIYIVLLTLHKAASVEQSRPRAALHSLLFRDKKKLKKIYAHEFPSACLTKM